MAQMSLSSVRWPESGLDVDQSYTGQREGTTVESDNVLNYDALGDRGRGGQRPGTSFYVSGAVSGANQVQLLDSVITSRAGVAASDSMSNRTLTAVAVAGGDVSKFTTSGFTAATNGTNALDPNAPVIFGAQLFGIMYFADGINEKQWTPGTNTVATWAESAGTMPVSGSDRPRLIELWRQRIVLAGLKGDDHNWFMSATGDANDWDYSPATTVETQATAGNNNPAGKVESIINCMLPYSDDLMLFGGDRSIYQMTSDPMAGGRIDSISNITGMAFGRPYAGVPDGSIYFIGSRGGLWTMAPTKIPTRVSMGRVDAKLRDFDFDNTVVRMAYDDVLQSLWIFLTPLDGSTATHYLYDLRRDAFWGQSFAATGMNPTALMVLDGDAASDRVMLMGGRDGKIRHFDSTAKSDTDSTAIASSIYLGPIKSREQAQSQLREIRGVMDCDCEVVYDVYKGDSSQSAYESSAPAMSGTFRDGKSYANRRRLTGHVFYIKLSNVKAGETWAFEALQVGRSSMGASRSRMPD